MWLTKFMLKRRFYIFVILFAVLILSNVNASAAPKVDNNLPVPTIESIKNKKNNKGNVLIIKTKQIPASKKNKNLKTTITAGLKSCVIPVGKTTCKIVGLKKNKNYKVVAQNIDSLGIRKSKKFAVTVRIGGPDWTKDKVNNSAPSVPASPISSGGSNPPSISGGGSSTNAGDVCTSMGSRVINSSGYLECRPKALNAMAYVQLSNSPSAPSVSTGSGDINTCQIIENKSIVRQPHAIGFPPSGSLSGQEFPIIGNVKVAFVPIDFSDSPGTGNPLILAQNDINTANEWLAQFSKERLTLDWVTHDSWIRAGSTSISYANDAYSFGADAQTRFNELLAAADPSINFTDVKYIFFYFPSNVSGINQEYSGRQRPTSGIIEFNPTGTAPYLGAVSFWGGGNYWASGGRGLWGVWLHEMFHSQGLAGHGPGNGHPLHIMANQDGPGFAISAWDGFLANWYRTNEVYCLDKSTLTSKRVVLSPLDRKEAGYKAAMVKISSTEILVIESRRKESEFSSGFRDGFYGILTYIVDVTKDNNRNDANFLEDDYFAKYLSVPGATHGTYQARGGTPAINMNWFMYEGESLTNNGVKIEFLTTGDHDEIRISSVP